MLTEFEAVQYLSQQGYLTPEAILNTDFAIKNASRRNHNFKIISEGHPSYLLKQGIGPEGSTTVAHEADICLFLQANAPPAFTRHLAHCYPYDADRRILLFGLIDKAQGLGEYHLARSYFSRALARAVGKALAALHTLTESAQFPLEGRVL